MTDSERTRAAAAEAIFGAALLIGGILLSVLSGFGETIGVVLIVLGAAGAAHAVLLGLGVVDIPSGRQSTGARRQGSGARRRR